MLLNSKTFAAIAGKPPKIPKPEYPTNSVQWIRKIWTDKQGQC